MLAPIDPRTGEPVPKKERQKFVERENGFYGRDIDRNRKTDRSDPKKKYAGLKPVAVPVKKEAKNNVS